MEDYIVNWVISGALFWSTTFLLVRSLLQNRSFDFCNRVVSTIHAAVAVSFASFSVQDWRCPACPLASSSSPLQMKALSVTLSYLIYDMVCCLFDENPKMDNLIHHVVSIVGIGAGLAYEMCGSEMVASMWITEISSPFLHMRELLKELGYRDTNLNFTVDVLFAITFSLARMVVGPCLTYVTLTAENPLLIKAMALGLQLVSAFWFYKIVKMLRYKIAKRTRTVDKAAKVSVH
ncbi:TLC domain-containing protein 5-like [Zingiber officinale]|uniref:TLC domain-containing protein n=1 Tax=Zingiber officinale TaxID=94328 RepID=A0A8J5EVU4_ZINOF|nr:TLC domain-containing protein 5-like [Zingiber officinale]KAG6475102.1 hypothetical protein ZIOFF_064320 [Zingiber officinale]